MAAEAGRRSSCRVMQIQYHAALAVIGACCGMWVFYWLFSSEPYLDRLDPHLKSRFFRTDGYYNSVLLYQTAPFIIVALLSFVVIELRKKLNSRTKNEDKESISSRKTPTLTTYPLIIKSFMGVLSSADVLFILGILFLVTYSFGRCCYVSFKELEMHYKEDPTHFDASLKLTKLSYAAYYVGRSAMIPFALLWIPVSRGSPFLRLINMPFENAVKYHIWLSMFSLFLLTLHGILYIAYYVAIDNAKEILSWDMEKESCSVVAGLIANIAGLLMWVTSLSFFRRRWYEWFFGIHHLYIVFFVFWLYHVMWTIHFITIPCLLFVVDRFLRLMQSRQSVDILSARLLESGAIELTIAKNNSEGLMYYALSSWYLRFPSLSKLMKLQWHFFSVTSTQMDEREELSIVIKPLGKWTHLLRSKLIKYTKMVDSAKCNRCPFTFKVGVEGPYGDESNFFLEYQVLVLIGGGIGVTPLLAILRDVLHRYRHGEKNLPSIIYLYHCVRRPQELCVLNSVDPTQILGHYQDYGLDIRVHVYVTSSSPTDYGDAPTILDTKETFDLATYEGFSRKGSNTAIGEVFFSTSGPLPQSISSISTKGSSLWVSSIIFTSIVGFFVLWGLSNVFLIKKYNAYFTNYSRTHVVAACMLLGTSLFGGFLVAIWWLKIKLHKKSKSTSRSSSTIGILQGSPNIYHEEQHDVPLTDDKDAGMQGGSPWNGTLQLSCRPNWKDIFVALDEGHKGQNIGVLVSGGLSMQEDVANQCKLHTKLFGRNSTSTTFHYHPISFDL